MKMTGAQILLKCLEREGVKHIFGYPGGVVIDIYDELARHPHIKHILVRHEQAAVHAADGYARASSQVGVALVTSGPGATNTVTGIASAYMDSIPIVVFTGQVPTALIGNDAFQEVDIVGITRPCTKHNYLVKDVKDLARTIHEAFYIARSGRPGPVLVDLPKDVSQASTVPKFPEDRQDQELQPHVPCQSPAGGPGPGYDPARQEAGALYRGRHRAVGQLGGTLEVRHDLADPGDQHPHGPGGLPRRPSPVDGDAGHARHLLRQYGGVPGRCADRGGGPV